MPEVEGISAQDDASALEGDDSALLEAVTGKSSIQVRLDPKDKATQAIIGVGAYVEMSKDVPALIRETRDFSERIAMGVDKLIGNSASGNGGLFSINFGGGSSKMLEQLSLMNNSSLAAVGTATDTIVSHIETISAQESKLSAYNTVVSAISGTMETLSGMDSLGTGIIKTVLGIAAGIAVLGLVAITLMPLIEFEDIAKLALFGATFAGIAWLLGKSGDSSLKAALAVATLGLAIWAFSTLVNPEQMGDTAISLAAIGGVLWAFSTLVKPQTMLLSAVGIAALGIALWGLTGVLESVAELDWEDLAKAGAAILGIVGIAALMGIPPISAAIVAGSVAMLALGVGMIALTGAMWLLSTMPEIDKSKTDNLTDSLYGLTDVFLLIGNPVAIAVTAMAAVAGLGMAIAIGTMTAALALINIAVIPDEGKVDAFGGAITGLVEAVNSVGGLDLAEAVAKSVGLVAIAGASTLVAGAISVMTLISRDPEKATEATMFIGNFVDGIVNTFKKYTGDDFALVTTGIASLSGISSLMAGMASTVAGISNLRFEETEIRDGKLVVTGVRQFTPEDFEKVGDSIGMIINSLISPLKAVGESGGFFSGNAVKKGIDAMTGIGAIFDPITNIISTFTSKGIGQTEVVAFNQNIDLLVNGLMATFSSDGELNEDMISQMGEATEILDSLINTVSDDATAQGVTNLNGIAGATVQIKDAINSMELEKLTKFNDVLFNMQQLEESDGFEKLANAILELIMKLSDIQTETESDPAAVQKITNTNTTTQQATQDSPDQNKVIELLQSGNEEVVDILTQLYEVFVSGQAKVKVSNVLS